MTKNRFYLFIILALLLLNVVLLVLHFNRPNRPSMPRDIIIERLKFDDQQIISYDKSIENHRETTNSYQDKINFQKNLLYQQLNQEKDSLKINSIVQNITELQKKVELSNFTHFEEIKKICKPEQLPLFKGLTSELSQLFTKKRPPAEK